MRPRPITPAERRARADALRGIVRSGQATGDVARLLRVHRSTVSTAVNGSYK